MSFYNLIHGVNPITIFVIPMLGDKHPDEYPRFRNIFLADDDHPEYHGYIHLYTRVGGGNRGFGYGEDELMKHPDFVTTFDDDFDNTYGTYIFKVPEKWKSDFALISEGNIKAVSDEYKLQVRKVFPKLKDQLDKIWLA